MLGSKFIVVFNTSELTDKGVKFSIARRVARGRAPP